MDNIYHAGLSLSNLKLQMVEMAKKSNHFSLENVDEVYFNDPLDLANDKETKIMSVLQNAYNELLLKKTINSTNVSFTLPANLFYVLQIPYEPRLLYSDQVEEFRKQISIAYPFLSSSNLVVRFFTTGTNSFLKTETAVIVALERKYLVLINAFCKNNNLTLKYIDNVHLASEKALFAIHAYDTAELTMSLYIANEYFSLIFSLKGKPIYYKLVPLVKFSEVVDFLRDEIIKNDLIERLSSNLIKTAYITGDGVSQTIADKLQNEVGIKFKLFNPFESISPNAKLLSNNNYSSKFNSFSPSAGISYRLA